MRFGSWDKYDVRDKYKLSIKKKTPAFWRGQFQRTF